MKETEFKVTLTDAGDVWVGYAKDYILKAGETWGGEREPHFDFFDMDGKVKVVRLIRRQA
jgi:hypothetical protein